MAEEASSAPKRSDPFVAPLESGPTVASMPLAQLEFCVLDVETTGLDAGCNRIVELALVRMDAHGRVLDELHTVVDPDGDGAGPTQVHGITDADLRGAPTFAQLAPAVRHLIGGALVVSHNAHFDIAFLHAELARAGLPGTPLPYACTMSLCRRLGLPGANAHRLTWAYWQEGVRLEPTST